MTLHDLNLRGGQRLPMVSALALARGNTSPRTRQYNARPKEQGLRFDDVNALLEAAGLALSPLMQAYDGYLYRSGDYFFVCTRSEDHYVGSHRLVSMLKSRGCQACKKLEQRRAHWRRLTT